MFTNRAAGEFWARRSAARLGATMVASVLTWATAHAGGVVGLSCVGGAKSFNCMGQWATGGDPYVRTVPQLVGEAQKAQLDARDRKWQARCHPVIERDFYGVARYQYAAPGCEFGLGTD